MAKERRKKMHKKSQKKTKRLLRSASNGVDRSGIVRAQDSRHRARAKDTTRNATVAESNDEESATLPNGGSGEVMEVAAARENPMITTDDRADHEPATTIARQMASTSTWMCDDNVDAAGLYSRPTSAGRYGLGEGGLVPLITSATVLKKKKIIHFFFKKDIFRRVFIRSSTHLLLYGRRPRP